MKLPLFDFQKDVLHALRDKLITARTYASSDNPQAIAFSAPTGSGKTIVMTSLLEAILVAPDDQLAWPSTWTPQPDAVILWVSDMPELNEQTRMKIESKSDSIKSRWQLVSIDSTFDAERLEGGRIYFINTQKLGTDKLLTKVGDGRDYSIWTTLTNTAQMALNRFYVVIDEAHRGMTGARAAREAQTIMQRFLLGAPEVGLVKMPLVIGLSATPKRFMDLLEQAPHTVHKVTIPVEDVRLSGLLKDRILIHHPKSISLAEMALLEEAARRWDELREEWTKYCSLEHESLVSPILVIQVENKTDDQLSKTHLSDALDVIESAIGRRLDDCEVAHAMHDVSDMIIGGRRIRRVEASRIDEDSDIGIVFFKTSLSTGWDCPRAEVMMSFRRAEDHTYIAQLLGRMVRTPLARRIERNAALNDVHLFLPHFDAGAVQRVIADLQNVEDVPPSEIGSSHELVVLKRREDCDEVFAAMESLITYRVNATRVQSPLRRYMAIARGLTLDGVDLEVWEQAKDKITGWMETQLSGLKEAGRFTEAAKEIAQVGLTTVAVSQGSSVTEALENYYIHASDADIERLFEESGRILSHGLHMSYWQKHGNRDSFEVKIEVIVLAKNHEAMVALEGNGETEFDLLYDLHKKEIGRLREQRRSYYEKLRLATAKPSEVPLHLPESIDFRRNMTDPLWTKHLYVEEGETFRAELGSWEAGVLEEELANPKVVAWLRNVDRKPWSLEIPYATGGEIRPMFPDFVIVRQSNKEFVCDILEPHDSSLADNYEKAVGLCQFAEKHGHLFGRIQLIRKAKSPSGEDHFYRLDINRSPIRKKVALILSNAQLDAIFATDAT